MSKVLLLNADYTPLHFINETRAIVMLYKCIAEVISFDGVPSNWPEVYKTSSIEFKVPATLRLLHRVNKRWQPVRFRKKVLFNRDGWRCQYCHVELNGNSIEVDHVIPKSRGGITSWKNCVSSCRACNKRKANKTPSEADMTLLKQPGLPSQLHFWSAARDTTWHADWGNFLSRE